MVSPCHPLPGVLDVDHPAGLEFMKFGDEWIVEKVASSAKKLMISGLPRALSIATAPLLGKQRRGYPSCF